jgi:glycosyltransferase involved in cell wall biosynthesis
MAEVYNALDLLCSSSTGEGFPNTIAEAMACGLSCVVTDVGDSAAIVGSLGVVVPPGDPEALARGCRTALERLASRGGANCSANRGRIEASFSVNQLADRTLDALGKIVGGNSQPGPGLIPKQVRDMADGRMAANFSREKPH